MMLLKKIPLLNNISKDFNLIVESLKNKNETIEKLQENVETTSEEIVKIKDSVAQKDILLINLFKEVECLKSDKKVLEKDLLTLISAIGSLHIVIESLMIDEHGEENYKKKFNYHW